MELEYPDCPLCQSREHRLEYDFSPFQVVGCQQCDFRFLHPRPTLEAMLALYSDEGYFHDSSSPGYEDYRSQEQALRLTFRRFLRELQSADATGGELLELGCGLGYFLSEAAPHFQGLTATDYSQGALDEISPSLATTHLGGLDAVPDGKQFGCVAMIQVLEHIYDPVDHLRAVRDRLRPNGVAAVVVPNYSSPLRWLLQKRWPSFKVPEHVMYFQEASLKKAFELAGYSSTRTLSYPHAFPLSLLLGKFGLKVPAWFGQKVVWVPTTCVALLGTR